MSGNFYFEGNGYFDGSALTNSSISNSTVTGSTISTTSLDMLDSNGQYQFITNVQHPVQPHDAATKFYVDALGIMFINTTLVGTTPTLISTTIQGSYVITVTNSILNGPTAVFHATKCNSTLQAHIARTVATPGVGTLNTLTLSWPPNSGIFLAKTQNTFDGNYVVKIM